MRVGSTPAQPFQSRNGTIQMMTGAQWKVMSHLGEARMCKQCLGLCSNRRNRLVTTCWDRFETHFHHCIHYHPFQSWCVVGFYFGNYGITWVWLISHDFSWLICRHTVPARARCFRRIARNAEVLGTARAQWRCPGYTSGRSGAWHPFPRRILHLCQLWTSNVGCLHYLIQYFFWFIVIGGNVPNHVPPNILVIDV